jgi:hypothetical protein
MISQWRSLIVLSPVPLISTLYGNPGSDLEDDEIQQKVTNKKKCCVTLTLQCLCFQLIPNCFYILVIDLDMLKLCFDIGLFPFRKIVIEKMLKIMDTVS